MKPARAKRQNKDISYLRAYGNLASAIRSLIALRENRRPSTPLLRQLEIRNFRNIHAARIELAPITVLIGKNNSGKTNLLTAIGFLFPGILEDKMISSEATIGDTGISSEADLFINLDHSPDPIRIGTLTAEGTFWVDLRNRYSHVKIAWLREVQALATLVASSSLHRRRWLNEPTGIIDGRRLGKRSAGRRAQDHEIGSLLQTELVGSARVSLNLIPEAEGPHIDDLPPIRYCEHYNCR